MISSVVHHVGGSGMNEKKSRSGARVPKGEAGSKADREGF
jgi:hypothetical protein